MVFALVYRGCVDQVFCLLILMEKACEFCTPLYLCFADLTKAYDSINMSALWSVLEWRYRLPPKWIHVLKAIHYNTKGKVHAYGHLSSPFQINNGVRQGEVLAPTLFNLFLDAVVDKALENHAGDGIRLFFHPDTELHVVGDRKRMAHESQVLDLEYADAICLVAASTESLEGMLHSRDRTCTDVGLHINTKKTKIMAVLLSTSDLYSRSQPVLLHSNKEHVEVMEDFEYLGSVVTSS